jgi:hypothetical protein
MCFYRKYPSGELDVSTGNFPFIGGVTFLKHPANSDKAKNKTFALWKKKIGYGKEMNRKMYVINLEMNKTNIFVLGIYQNISVLVENFGYNRAFLALVFFNVPPTHTLKFQ